MALCSCNWSHSVFNDFSVLHMNVVAYLMDFQCAMCRAVLESGADQKTAESLNDGDIFF